MGRACLFCRLCPFCPGPRWCRPGPTPGPAASQACFALSWRFSSVEWRTVKMYVAPLLALLVPDARFLGSLCRGHAIRPETLDQAHVGDHGNIAHDADAWRTHGRLMRAADAAELEVKMVKRQAF